jgi:hypothetical protein
VATPASLGSPSVLTVPRDRRQGERERYTETCTLHTKWRCTQATWLVNYPNRQLTTTETSPRLHPVIRTTPKADVYHTKRIEVSFFATTHSEFTPAWAGKTLKCNTIRIQD